LQERPLTPPRLKPSSFRQLFFGLTQASFSRAFCEAASTAGVEVASHDTANSAGNRGLRPPGKQLPE
jgi:hypothetical protein